MVQHVHISKECPQQSTPETSILDDEFRFTDGLLPKERASKQEKRKPARNLPAPNVPTPVVQSRRTLRGRPASSPLTALRKQISISLTYHEWKLLRGIAAEQHIPLSQFCYRWLAPHIERLQNQEQNQNQSRRESTFEPQQGAITTP